ncbi:hypothetical protein [Luteolibacter sp. LG18]|uniref:hypothetical protein n=1 Tax=Luteolibacter sp. LG18 TaxID=2819286 RepID=UPI002B282F1A|nr:hypothetical protein llg_23490 [Luteolibacter sp. LG18]
MKLHKLLTVSVALGVSAFSGIAQAAPKGPKPPKPTKEQKQQAAFEKADANDDGFLDIFEFASTQGPGTPLVEVRARFLPIDTAGAFEPVYQTDPNTGEPVLDPNTGEPVIATDPNTGEPLKGDPIPDGLISLDEWNAYQALGKKTKDHTLSRFELADFDGDGVLSPEEFGYLVSPKVKFTNVLRGFEKKDLDDDGFLTEDEYNGVKTGA